MSSFNADYNQQPLLLYCLDITFDSNITTFSFSSRILATVSCSNSIHFFENIIVCTFDLICFEIARNEHIESGNDMTVRFQLHEVSGAEVWKEDMDGRTTIFKMMNHITIEEGLVIEMRVTKDNCKQIAQANKHSKI